MSKLGTLIILSALVMLLPWLGFAIWENLPQNFRINSNHLRYVFNALIGLIIGVIIFKKEIKLSIIPILILLFTSSAILWNINRFNSHKRDLESKAIEYPLHIPECEKESNFESFWDYIQNGCHITVDDFVGSLLNKVLILTIAILLSRTISSIIIVKRNKRKDKSIIDQVD